MDLITVRELYKHPEEYLDKEINVGGWVRSLRDSKAFGFIVVSDGSFFETLQIVYHDTLPNFAEVSKLSVGTAILVKGTLEMCIRDRVFTHLRKPRNPDPGRHCGHRRTCGSPG